MKTKRNNRPERWLLLLLLVLLISCGRNPIQPNGASSGDSTAYVRPDCNAVYYWKTRFALKESERAFLEEHGVGRIYLRFFDVDVTEDLMGYSKDVVPIGTVTFDSTKPAGVEIVPTVFITVPAISVTSYQEQGFKILADRIVTRVLNMADFNDMGPIHEIQLDCDWTGSTRDDFYRLCREVRALLQPQGITLSATVRLHQLRQGAPPVDRGVLMVYNTGSVQQGSTRNSIIDEADVRQYLKGGPVQYDLPLDFAWPAYGWGVWFRDGKFRGLLHHTDYSDSKLYAAESDGMLRVCKEHQLEGHSLLVGDRIRPESSPYATLVTIKELVEKSFPGPAHGNIIYHLDSLNLSHYTSDEITTLFGR